GLNLQVDRLVQLLVVVGAHRAVDDQGSVDRTGVGDPGDAPGREDLQLPGLDCPVPLEGSKAADGKAEIGPLLGGDTDLCLLIDDLTYRSDQLRLVPGLLLGLEEHVVGVERRVVREEYAPLALVKELLQIRAEKDLRVGPQQYECVGSLEGGQQDRRDIEPFLEGTTGEHAVLLNEMLCERRVGDSSGLIVL